MQQLAGKRFARPSYAVILESDAHDTVYVSLEWQ